MSDNELRDLVKHFDQQRTQAQARKKENRKQAKILSGEHKNLLEDFGL